MPNLKRVVALVFVIGMTPSILEAQRTRADTAQVILEVSNELRAAGHHSDADDLLRLLVNRFPNTSAAVDAERELTGVRREGRPGSGTIEFVAWHTALGVTLGALVPAAFDADSPEAYGAGLLLGGPLGYALSRALTTKYPLTSGQALMIDYGSIWGMIQAPLWYDILDLGDETVCFGASNGQCFVSEGDAGAGTAIVGALSGLGVGLALASTRPISSGTALNTIFGSQWGMTYGLLGAVFAGQRDEDAFATWIVVGGNAGLLAGIFGGPRLEWSASRAWLVTLSGAAGLIAGGGFALLVSAEDEKFAAVLFGLGGALGLAAGVASTADMDASPVGSFRGGGLSSSLIDASHGNWNIGLPVPQPTLLPSGDFNQRPYTRGWKVNLFRASW